MKDELHWKTVQWVGLREAFKKDSRIRRIRTLGALVGLYMEALEQIRACRAERDALYEPLLVGADSASQSLMCYAEVGDGRIARLRLTILEDGSYRYEVYAEKNYIELAREHGKTAHTPVEKIALLGGWKTLVGYEEEKAPLVRRFLELNRRVADLSGRGRVVARRLKDELYWRFQEQATEGSRLRVQVGVHTFVLEGESLFFGDHTQDFSLDPASSMLYPKAPRDNGPPSHEWGAYARRLQGGSLGQPKPPSARCELQDSTVHTRSPCCAGTGGNMKQMIIKCEQGKKPVLTEIPELSLKAMQTLVGGLVQPVTLDDDEVTLWCNDEGKLLGLPLNAYVTDDWGNVWDINGDFFLCGFDYDEGESIGLTTAQATKWMNRLQEGS